MFPFSSEGILHLAIFPLLLSWYFTKIGNGWSVCTGPEGKNEDIQNNSSFI
jgi:hypothetical protein